MLQKIRSFHIISIFIIMLLGALLHFVYGWFNNPVVAVFGSINESVWEHLKLLFWPSLLMATIEYFYIGYKFKNYILAKAISIYIGVLLIISIFYTYTGIIGSNFLILDLLTFIISVILSNLFSYYLIKENKFQGKYSQIIGLSMIFILSLAFVAFTRRSPDLPLFTT